MIYGAYGYTGKLIVELAVSKGYKPLIGGRDATLIKALAEKHDLPYVAFSLDDLNKSNEVFGKIDLLLNCAGPFELTMNYTIPACLQNKVHYLDITGEIEVFQWIASLHKEAVNAGIVMLPGTGFDVVPSDCLALFLKKQLPDATHLEMAFQGSNSGLSRGTALSMARRFHKGGAYRKDKKIIPVPAAHETKTIHYGGMDRLSVLIPWGDVFTAFHSTGIPNIKVFTGVPEKTIKAMRTARKFGFLLGTGFVQAILKRTIRKKITGPSKEQNQTSVTHLWGQVSNGAGNTVTAQVTTPEAYWLTANTALKCAEGILAGKVQPGYSTPAQAFGEDFILEFEGVKRNIVST